MTGLTNKNGPGSAAAAHKLLVATMKNSTVSSVARMVLGIVFTISSSKVSGTVFALYLEKTIATAGI